MKNRFLQLSIAILVVLFFGCSTSSDENGNTTSVVPLAPSGLIGVVTSSTQINLAWTDNSTNENGFKIERRTGSANYLVVGTVNQDTFAFSDSGLTPNTTYTYRVYAFNAVGNSLSYTNEVSFTSTVLPTLTTAVATSITQTTAISGGTISNDAGTAITTRGVCWSTSPNPTISLPTITTNGTGLGIFTSNITGLEANTTYYVRAYATNYYGTAYGNEVSFTTSALVTLPSLTTIASTSITQTTASSGGIISGDGGASITVRGVCWSTSPNPSIELITKTTDGNGTGVFLSNITDLSNDTTYYLRAYATNSLGTEYGNEITFTTLAIVSGPNIIDIDGNSYQSVTNCGLTYTKQNLNVSKYTDGTPIPQVTDLTQWYNLTTGAWCYYNNTTSNGTTYDKLYNWYAVMGIYDTASATNPNLRKKLAPAGWHIPTDAEWTQLTDCLGGALIAGGKMKSIGTSFWQNSNIGATNSSGFTGLPGGYRTAGGTFSQIGIFGFWWSYSEYNTTQAFAINLVTGAARSARTTNDMLSGLSVRCVKD